MRIAYLSHQGDNLDLAFRLGVEGHEVRTYIEEDEDKRNFDGIIPKARTWQDAVKGAQLAVFDDNKLDPRIYDSIHRTIPCFGGSPFAARLEKDRAFAHSIMKISGIEQVESKTFKRLQDVIPHLQEHKVPHVIKPEGPEVKSYHTIIGDEADNSDSISQVERLIDNDLKVRAVEVEERKRGVEVGLLFFFNGLDKVGPVCMSFEHKRSHEGERGNLTGEMGTLIRYIESDDLPLYQETLKKIIPTMRAANYRGMIDLNMIVGRDEKGERFIAPLEFTPRIPNPMIFIQDELHVTPWAELLMACASGKDFNMQVRYDWGVGVVLTSFGFPFQDKSTEISSGLEAQGINEQSLLHIHPSEMMLNKKGKFVLSPGEGYILTATGRGETINSAKDMAYEELSRIKIPNTSFRRDISDKISIYELDSLGILSRDSHEKQSGLQTVEAHVAIS